MKLLLGEKRLDRAERIQLYLSYILQLIIFGAVLISLYMQEWFNAAIVFCILILTFIPAIVRRNYKVYLPVEFDFITVTFIFLAIFLGEIHGYYTTFWWWDVVLHTGSGFLLGLAGFVLVYILNREKQISVKMKAGFIAFFALCFALAVGAFWEIIEFTVDQLFGLYAQKGSLVDTMWDLVVDLLGALIISLIGYFYLKKGHNFFLFDRMLRKLIENNPQLFKKGKLRMK